MSVATHALPIISGSTAPGAVSGGPVDFAVLHEQPHLSIYDDGGDFRGDVTTGQITLPQVKTIAADFGLVLTDAVEGGDGRTRLYFGLAGAAWVEELELESEGVFI